MKDFERLPDDVKQSAIETFHAWNKDPYSVNFVSFANSGAPNAYRVALKKQYRAIGYEYAPGLMIWLWIGSHEQYNSVWQKYTRKFPQVSLPNKVKSQFGLKESTEEIFEEDVKLLSKDDLVLFA